MSGDKLYEDNYEILNSDPDVIKYNSMETGTGVVCTRTAIQPMTFLNPDGTLDFKVEFPQKTFKSRVQGIKPEEMTFALTNELDRVSEYIDFVFNVSLPMSFIMVYKSFKLPYSLRGKELFIPDIFNPERREDVIKQIREKLERGFEASEILLKSVTRESILDISIRLLGRSNTTLDQEQSFLTAWKSLESVSKADFSEAIKEWKKGNLSALGKYINVKIGKLENGKALRIAALDKVKKTLGKAGIRIDSSTLKILYDRRNRIAHLSMNAKDFKNIISDYTFLYSKVKELVIHKLSSYPGLEPHLIDTLRECSLV